MLVKVVLVFLLVMLLLGMVGKLLLPGARKRRLGRCDSCGRPRIGRQACPCGKGA